MALKLKPETEAPIAEPLPSVPAETPIAEPLPSVPAETPIAEPSASSSAEAATPPAEPRREARPEDAPLTCTVVLEGVFKDWLKARALHHNQEPGEHAAMLLRAYWAHHDAWRHTQAGTLTVRREG